MLKCIKFSQTTPYSLLLSWLPNPIQLTHNKSFTLLHSNIYQFQYSCTIDSILNRKNAFQSNVSSFLRKIHHLVHFHFLGSLI